MFGRDGILAHTYMLGPTGASFGCVSFKNYSAFLQAFSRGEIDRLVVVPHLGAKAPGEERARLHGAGLASPSTTVESCLQSARTVSRI